MVRHEFANALLCCDACSSFSELSQALNIGAVKRIEADGRVMVVTLDVSEQFSRAPILAMFAGLQMYWQDRAGLDETAGRVWKFGPPLIQPTRPSQETLDAIDATRRGR